jgi:hypothetical protein
LTLSNEHILKILANLATQKLQPNSMKFSYSKSTFFFLFFFYLLSLFYFKNWDDYILDRGDTHGFYAYLPALFIHHDIDNLRKTNLSRISNRQDYNSDYTIETIPERWIEAQTVNGKKVIPWNCGVAVMQLPFFTISHMAAKILGYRADGYSKPYRLGLLFGNFCYVLLGFWWLRQLLCFYFKESVVSLTLLTLGLATNLYVFTVFNGFMSHSYLFFLYVALMRSTHQFYTAFTSKSMISIGFLVGLIVLTRPPDVWVITIPLLFGLYKWTDISQRFGLFWQKKGVFFLSILAFLIPISLQLIYWKYITSHWLFYLYGEAGFDFTKPHIQVGLFSFKNGWLTYTPVMVLALLGLFFKQKNDYKLAIWVFMIGYVYTIYSWQILYYINGFGSRPMVEAYAFLSIPLSIFLNSALKNRWKWIFTTIFIFFCSWLNIIQTYQFSTNMLVSEISNFAFWRSTFGKTKLDYKALVALDSDEYQPEKPTQWMKTLYENDFKDSIKGYQELKPQAYFNLKNLKGSDVRNYKYLKFSIKANSPNDTKIYELFGKSLIVAHFRRGESELKYTYVKIEPKLGGELNIYAGKTNIWDEVVFYVNIPSDLQSNDDILCYIWNNNKFSILIDDVTQSLHN